MKAVLINSTEPIGSSVVSAIVEKFGYLNIPIRDLGLHDYLIDKDHTDMEKLRRDFYHVVICIFYLVDLIGYFFKLKLSMSKNGK